MFAESLATVAVNVCVPATVTLAADNDSVTVIGGGREITVMVARADFVVSATDVAFNVTAGGFGKLAGAV